EQRTMTRMTRGRAALGLALPVILAGLVAGLRTPRPPAVRTITVGRTPLALAVDEHTRRVFVANYGAASVTMLDAASGATLATVPVAPQPSTLAVATTAGRVFAVSDDVTLAGADQVSMLDATSGRLLRTVAGGQGEPTL